MSRILVFDASPTIILAKIGRLDLALLLASECWLPDAVASEILQGPPNDPAFRAVFAGWGQRASTNIPTTILEWGLGVGESSVLSLVLEHAGWIAVLDDAKARQCAKALGVPVLGTIGLILLAKKIGVVPQAAPIFREILRAGLYLEESFLRNALAQVGESWES
ncbi:DUF3368 domain-containing protein [Myxococcota bacterium]|nr:DUF3368 domain-containing protein [Myxococcota bacterium]